MSRLGATFVFRVTEEEAGRRVDSQGYARQDADAGMTESDHTNASAGALESEGLDWVNRLLSGAVTAQDAKAFRAWRSSSAAHGEAFAEAVRFRHAVRGAILAERGEVRDSRRAVGTARISSLTGLATSELGRSDLPTPARLSRRVLLTGGLAASFAGYMVVDPPAALWPSWSEFMSDYRTGAGQARQVAVAPGVAMELNTRTSITLDHSGPITGVHLISGEAMITARRPAEAPFAVLAGAGRTRVAEASVDVRLDGDKVCVTCLSGAVEISHPRGRQSVQAGQQVTYTGDEVGSMQPVDAAVTTAWRRGLLIFRDAPLEHVVDELNRYRRGRIVLVGTALARRPVYGVFQIREIGRAVKQVQQLTGARATNLPGGLVVLS